MPAGTSSSVGSSATRLAEGTTVCPFFSKKLRKRRAISAVSIDALLCIRTNACAFCGWPPGTRPVDDNGGGLVVPRLTRPGTGGSRVSTPDRRLRPVSGFGGAGPQGSSGGGKDGGRVSQEGPACGRSGMIGAAHSAPGPCVPPADQYCGPGANPWGAGE